MQKRPLTQREIKNRKTDKANEPRVTVSNTTKRMIILQLRDKNSDFYLSERSIYLRPGKMYSDRRSLFNESQLNNLRAKGEVRIISNDV